jgi:hypothetical protein
MAAPAWSPRCVGSVVAFSSSSASGQSVSTILSSTTIIVCYDEWLASVPRSPVRRVTRVNLTASAK